VLLASNHLNPADNIALAKFVYYHAEAVPERLVCRLAKLVQLGARDVVEEFRALASHFRRIAKTEPEFHV